VQGDAKAAKHINVTINSGLMSGNMIFQITNIQESSAKIEEAERIALLKSVRDFELAIYVAQKIKG
jgi:hypothetical protein